jgi:epoxyqueuosine reductase
MKDQLDQLAERIEVAYPGSPLRSYVDTGPILERELAEMAGLGVVGKNTNLLHPEGGSWFLLGELFLALDLETDPAVSDLCGSCTRCLEACPTGALPEPYRLDSRRCISYWTIEHRGAIPVETRPLLGRWIFGCDICQEVCPFNESPAQADHPELRLPPERDKIDLVALLLISREDYVAAFRGSPMKRAKQLGLQRNAAIAMGNSRDSQYLPALDAALQSHQQILRSHAAWAIGQIGGFQAKDSLEKRLSEEEDASVLQELRLALASCRESELPKQQND